MKRSAAEILTLLERHAQAIRSHGVRRLGLFGSAARGLKTYLENLLGCRIDLVVAEAIKPRLRDTILGEALHAPGL
jgi:predicted nucleotidyltransferase